MVQTPARRLLRREERHASILHGAAAAFAGTGFAATSMEDVAEACGITKLIVYRHFASKEELYDAVLERVSDRWRDLFVAGLQNGPPSATAVQALLRVAREDPAGFTLLWRHAAREPQFADHAGDIRARGVNAAEALLASAGVEPGPLRRWAAETLISYLVSSVLHWMERGRETDDDLFVGRVTRSLPAMIRAWTDDVASG